MNGPEHYREAERALASVRGHAGHLSAEEVAYSVAIAQVHATLALAAATAESHDPDGLNVPDWSEVTR